MKNTYSAMKRVTETTLLAQPQIKVYLKRLPNDTALVYCGVYKGEFYIYDMFANKYYTFKNYGKKWAFNKEELEK